jgi:hypothetical protein
MSATGGGGKCASAVIGRLLAAFLISWEYGGDGGWGYGCSRRPKDTVASGGKPFKKGLIPNFIKMPHMRHFREKKRINCKANKCIKLLR